jgi:3-phosphoshikimate 1-carboxyvinyltransferase
VGDPSLMKRDMSRLEDPLAAIGGRVKATNGTAPLVVGGADMVGHADVTIPMASAQVRTAFELAALAGDASSTIDSPAGFRDHTERWLSAIGRGEFISETRFRIDPGPIPPARFDVPGDPSSGAFLWAAAAISPGSTIVTPHVSLNPGRLGFLEILERMGAQVQAVVTDSVGGDPVGTVTVTGATLEGVTVAGALATAALDELPLVAVVAAYADGITTVRDAGELRAKESDRIGTIEAMLVALGGGIAVVGDGFDVVGTGFLDGGVVDPHHDHRIAMAGAVAATRASRDVEIVDSNVVEVSWPEFYDVLGSLWS